MECKNCHMEDEPIYREVGNHIGAFCPHCGHWIKWVSKEDLSGVPIIIKKDNLAKPLF